MYQRRPILICAVVGGVIGLPLLGAGLDRVSAPAPAQQDAAAPREVLARRQGEAYAKALAFECRHAAWSVRKSVGEAEITVTLTPPEESWQRQRDGRLQFVPAPRGMVHMRVFVADALDGRFVPGLTVHARFYDAAGYSLGAAELPFGLYPLTDAYGANITVPPEASQFAVYLDTLTANRDGEWDGDKRFRRPIRAQFTLDGLGPVTGEAATALAARAPEALLLAQREALSAARSIIAERSIRGGEIPAGDILVGYAVGAVETGGTSEPRAGLAAQEKNARLEVIPRDAAAGRFLPGAKVTATVESFDGNPIRTVELPFRWSPWLHRYGESWVVPRAQPYRITLRIDPPDAPVYGGSAARAQERSVELMVGQGARRASRR